MAGTMIIFVFLFLVASILWFITYNDTLHATERRKHHSQAKSQLYRTPLRYAGQDRWERQEAPEYLVPDITLLKSKLVHK